MFNESSFPQKKRAPSFMAQLETLFTGAWRSFNGFIFKLLHRSFFCR